MKRTLLCSALLILVSNQGYAVANDADNDTANTIVTSMSSLNSTPLANLQHQWAHINYEVEEDGRAAAFISLLQQAQDAVKASPNDAELLIWQGIIQSSTAGAKGGLAALDYAKAARKSFELAMHINENALSGSAMTSLGVLYHKLPGWPISFGSDKKAQQLLEHALEINPLGIDPNYFYAEFLYDNKHYDQARLYVLKAKQAASRPSRPLADRGRRKEISLLEAKINQKS